MYGNLKNVYHSNKSLEEDIKSEISGNFLASVLGLLDSTDDYEAKCIRKAIKVILKIVL